MIPRWPACPVHGRYCARVERHLLQCLVDMRLPDEATNGLERLRGTMTAKLVLAIAGTVSFWALVTGDTMLGYSSDITTISATSMREAAHVCGGQRHH